MDQSGHHPGVLSEHEDQSMYRNCSAGKNAVLSQVQHSFCLILVLSEERTKKKKKFCPWWFNVKMVYQMYYVQQQFTQFTNRLESQYCALSFNKTTTFVSLISVFIYEMFLLPCSNSDSWCCVNSTTPYRFWKRSLKHAGKFSRGTSVKVHLILILLFSCAHIHPFSFLLCTVTRVNSHRVCSNLCFPPAQRCVYRSARACECERFANRVEHHTCDHVAGVCVYMFLNYWCDDDDFLRYFHAVDFPSSFIAFISVFFYLVLKLAVKAVVTNLIFYKSILNRKEAQI